MKQIMTIVILLTLGLMTGCQSVGQHRQAVANTEGERVTVGTVQKEIKIGMPGAEVAAALGSPNIVSTDSERREVWIYDKLSTETAYSTSKGGVNVLVLGLLGGSAGGGIGGGYSSSTGASSTSQRTLTVIIKFDKNSLVRDFAYHTSRF